MTAYQDIRPTAADSAFRFYDLESLSNAFTVAVYHTHSNLVEMFYLLDDLDVDPGKPGSARAQQVSELMAKSNPTWLNRIRASGDVAPLEDHLRFYDLAEDASARRLAHLLGGITENRSVSTLHTRGVCEASRLPIRCDTGSDYDPTDPEYAFIAGYNSNTYDTTVLALYFALRFNADGSANPVDAATMREHNDGMFALARGDDRKSMTWYLGREGVNNFRAATIRSNWLSTGRHLDISRLNETQMRVALKGLLGTLGYQVLESDKLSGKSTRISTEAEFWDLVAYNISDTVGTAVLFEHPAYSGSFDLRAGLLRTYPETVFAAKPDTSPTTPDITPGSVLGGKRRRLTADTPSAQFAGRILAPYRDLWDIPGHVADLPVVSFRYPDPLMRTRTIPGDNVLTKTRDFFHQALPPTTAAAKEAHRAFEQVYTYYRRIEGVNFNHTQANAYEEDNHGDSNSPLGILNKVRYLLRTLAEERSDPRITAAWGGFVKLFGEGIDHKIVRLTYGQFYSWYATTLQTLASVYADNTNPEAPLSGDAAVSRADLHRLYALITAKADAAQPYWPADGPATLLDTIVEWDTDPKHQINKSHDLSEIARLPGNIAYVDANGEPTSCFAAFSTGGIHGAEAHREAFAEDLATQHYLWERFLRIIDAGLEGYTAAKRLLESGGEMTEKQALIVTDGFTWATEHHTDMPEILGRDGDAYDTMDLALATWWIRKSIRVTIADPKTGEDTVMKWDEVITGKADNPQLRPTPKGYKVANLFIPKKSTKLPLLPVDVDEHIDNRLNGTYGYTSIEDVIHEDFTSYYPLMLVNLAAFTNPDLAEPGQPAPDRYSEIFADKERYGKLRKQPGISDAERDRYDVLRNGTKLILNAASGAADASHETPILMNNMIITMRIIGQLFSWRIGQAQTIAGGRIVSTNTDGLYSTLDEETNQKVLDEHTAAINVEIEPEPLTLVSKDSNNRVEFLTAEESAEKLAKKHPNDPAFAPEILARQPWRRVVAAAGGGSVACWNGPTPTKKLAHPAMTDRLLVEYFKRLVGKYRPQAQVPYSTESVSPLTIEDPMDPLVLNEIINELHSQLELTEVLRLYQNMISSSPSKHTHPYQVPVRKDENGQIRSAADALTVTIPGDDRTITDDPETLGAPGAHIGYRVADAQPAQVLGHYTRIFLINSEVVASFTGDDARIWHETFGVPVVIASARAAVVPANIRASRQAKGAPRIANVDGINPVAAYLLDAAGDDPYGLSAELDLKLTRHPGLSPTQPAIVFNQTIIGNPQPRALQLLGAALDFEAYKKLAIESYETNWRNRSLINETDASNGAETTDTDTEED